MDYEDKLVVRIICAIIVAVVGAITFLVITVFCSEDSTDILQQNIAPNTINTFTICNSDGELMYQYINNNSINVEYDSETKSMTVTVPAIHDSCAEDVKELEAKFEQFHKQNYCYDACDWFFVCDKTSGMYEICYGTKQVAKGFVLDKNDVAWLDDNEVIQMPSIFVTRQSNTGYEIGGRNNDGDKANWWME